MNKKFQILSLDGGGIKGLFSAAILSHWESDLKTSITKHFDLIVGTSTGGIIAIGLGLGLSPKDIVNFYVSQGGNIFGRKRSNFFKNKYLHDPLEKALKDGRCFGDRLFGESKVRLVIPSYNLGEDDIYLFKTAHHERLTRDYKVPAWKVALATSAAPTYFPVCNEIDRSRHIDGGIWANNPSMVGLIEAITLLGASIDQIRVMSLGTTDEVVERPEGLNNGGLWQWKNQAIKVALRGQSIGVNAQVSLLLGKENILRLDPKVPDKLFALDKLSEDALLSKAAHVSRHSSPSFKEKFMDHAADPFEPFHKC